MKLQLKTAFVTIFLLGIFAPNVFSQGFGRNKPKYKQFDFEVYKTTHFDIYHYFDNPEVVENLAWQSELWHEFIQAIVQDTIHFQNPLIFYADHGDFQQTNTISSTVGVTTGGVTEAFKNRVTMPVTISNQKTFQVLGHELVHAFQFDMIIRGDSTSLESLANLPLFMVEGMAEYITRGRIDPFTSMWMRDIVINDKIPSVEEMFSPKYFPYRYGQAFWAVMTDKYGDAVMRELLRATAKYELKNAAPLVLGISVDEMTDIWQTTLKSHYENLMPRDTEDFVGRKLLDDENAGKLNISPSISPNGKYVIFLSEKGIFTTELFLADATNGKIIRKIASTLRDNNYDNLDAFESAGTWSPDSKRYAFVGFKKGRNKIFVKTVDNAKNEDEFFIEGINGINSPTWSPDGKHIAFTGLKDGQVDLYSIDVKSRKITQHTNTIYSEIQPSWSSDSKKIVYATDEVSMTNRPNAGPWYHNLALITFANNDVEQLNIFPFSDNLNPQFDENNNIWFLSDRDGFRNIYKYEVEADSLFQQTDFLTGVSGISWFAPAISVARKRDKIVFTHYYDGKYEIYGAREKAFLRKSVAKNDVDRSAGTLPGNLSKSDMINVGLATLNARPVENFESFQTDDYKPKLTLDDIRGSAGVGVSTGLYGNQTGALGGVQAVWSDVLGDHTIGALANVNGELQDAGLTVQYINKKGRVHWGFGLGHAPPQRAAFGGRTIKFDPTRNANFVNYQTLRIFQEQASILSQYPINRNVRIEGNISTTYQHFGLRNDTFLVDGFGRAFAQFGDRQKNLGDELQVGRFIIKKGFLHSAGAALVGDNSYFGIASPMAGYRYRFGVDHYVGSYDFTTVTADVRKYFWLKPISIGLRGFHYSRLGADQNQFNPIFLGWQGFVRGIGNVGSVQELSERYGLGVSQLEGSKVLMAQAEVRLPFTGPKQLSLIGSRFLFTELAAFVDAGTAFDEYNNITFSNKLDETRNLPFNKSVVIMTAGLSMRINLFGALILEPYYAVPLRENGKGEFGLNFLMPGW